MLFVGIITCSTPSGLSDEPFISLFDGYPLPIDSLQPARPFLVKGDGEGLYRLAGQNDAALKKRLDEEAFLLRQTFCEECNDECRKRRMDHMKDLTGTRNLAQARHLRLRLDALQSRLEAYSRKSGVKIDMSEFRRSRLLLETVAEERLLLIQNYWLLALRSCGSAALPEQRWFLPYYTAYFKLINTLPAGFRSTEFFP